MGTVSTEKHPTMNSLTLPTLLCALAASLWAPTAVLAREMAAERNKPLDLSLPKEAPSRAWGAPARQDAMSLPDPGGQPSRPTGVAGPGRGGGGGPRSDLPYGSGYEARHGQGGGGSNEGGGHGMGRGRGR